MHAIRSHVDSAEHFSAVGGRRNVLDERSGQRSGIHECVLSIFETLPGDEIPKRQTRNGTGKTCLEQPRARVWLDARQRIAGIQSGVAGEDREAAVKIASSIARCYLDSGFTGSLKLD